MYQPSQPNCNGEEYAILRQAARGFEYWQDPLTISRAYYVRTHFLLPDKLHTVETRAPG